MSLLILIAEDDPGVRIAVQGHLETFGYSVIMAENGEEALLKIQQYRPHLLVSDINMPKKNGYDLVKEIRKFPEFRLLPVVFLTEYHQVADRVRGYGVGCDAYLAKPFEVAELEAVIRNLLERSQIINNELIAAQNYQPHLSHHEHQHIPQDDREIIQNNSHSLKLTNKEQQVLKLVARGFSNINIGRELHLSHRTIEKYVSRLLKKTNTKNRAELVRLVLEKHLI